MQVDGRQGRSRAQYQPTTRKPRVWASNGLRLRRMTCAWCGHYFGSEAVERGYEVFDCPECKAHCEFPIDRTQEPRNYDAYAFQERQVLEIEALPELEPAHAYEQRNGHESRP